MEEPKTIKQDQYLTALALFTQANSLYYQLRQVEHALIRHLGQLDQGSVSDLIYHADTPASIAEFDEALKHDGFILERDAAVNQ